MKNKHYNRISAKLLCLAFLFVIASNSLFGQVTVTATLAGTGPTSYLTINAAFAAINAGTHQGMITISITGNMVEPNTPVPLLQSAGTSSYTSISIKPSGGNFTIAGGTPVAGRGLIELQGADNVTIDGDDPGTSGLRNLTFQQSTSTLTNISVVRFASSSSSDGATFNTLKNCNIIGSRSSIGSSTTNYGIYSGTPGITAASTSGQSDNNDNLTIQNNAVSRCYWGIYCAGTTANYMDNLLVKNNVIGSSTSGFEVANRGVYIQNTQAVTTPGATVAIVDGNDIQMTASTGGAGTCMGIEVANGNAGALIRGNNVHDIRNPGLAAGAYGIGISGSTQNASVTIYNNFVRDVSNNTSFGVSLGNSGAAYGIVLTVGAANLRVYYNSVNLNTPNLPNGTSTEVTCAFAVTSTAAGVTNLDIRNNIFSNTQTTPLAGDKRYAIYLAGTITAIGTINNNDYHSAGTGSGSFILGNFNGVDKTTLSAWQGATGQDGASGSFNPSFTSTTDLHIPPALSQLESGAVAISGITTDFDGDVRPGPAGSVNGGGTLPDMGADEFDGTPADLTPPIITYSILGPTCNTTDRILTATISDASGIPVTGSLQPRIYYKKNAGSYFSSQGVFTSGTATNGTWTFTIVVADMGGVTIGDQVSYYVIAQDVAGTPNIVSNPAGVTATNVNTVSSPPPTPNNFFVQGPLGGTFNVGVAQTYTTLTAAVNAYNGSCLTGPVTFVLTDATYPSETFPITITSNAYTSAVNTLTIKPNTGVAVSISGTSAAAIIKINGGDYVTIDGLNTGGSLLTLTNNDAVSTTSTVIWVGSTGASDAATNNAIKNCNLIGNASTTTFAGVFAGSGTTVGAAGNAEAPNNQLTVQGCSFIRMRSGIYANGNATTSDANWSFTQNTIGSTVATDKLSASAIILFNAQNFTVNNNIINGVASASTTTASGIGVFSNILNGTIYRNKISDIKNSNNGAAQGSNGIQLSATNTGANVSVYNNFIWDVASFGSANTSATANGWGILISGGGGYNIYYNSVYLSTDQTFATGITAAINITNGVNTTNAINLRNNIFANTQTVGTQRYAIICAGAFGATTFTDINYNDYFFSGPNLGALSGAKVDLAAWQGATLKDGNSKSINPFFISTSDLHLNTVTAALDSAGTPIATFTNDIDGDLRNANFPDIGADEFDKALAPCSGAPEAGSIPATAILCPGFNTTLNITGYTNNVAGITFQWQESNDNGVGDAWANAVGGSGGTTFSYTIPNLTSDIYYRCIVTCSNTSQYDSTNVCAVTVTPFTLPEDFSSVTFPPGCWAKNAPYIFRANASAFGSGTGSAEFNFYVTGTFGVDLDLLTPLFTPFPAGYKLSFDQAYASYGGEVDSLVILYSTNGGSSYNTLIVYEGGTTGPLNTGGNVGNLTQFVPTASQWASKTVTVPAGTNRIIFRGRGQFGNNLYIDNINISAPPPCITPPVGGVATGPSTGCAGPALTYNVAGGSGSYQWQSSFNASPYTDLTGDTAATLNFTATQTGTYNIRCLRKSLGCDDDSSNVVTTTVSAFGPSVNPTASPASVCPGSTVNLSANASQENRNVSGTINLPVPDNNPAGASSTLAVSGMSGNLNGAAIRIKYVKVKITHFFDADLDISLTGPNNATIDLSSDNGSSDDNYTNTIFDDNAATSITLGSAPFTGSFQSEQPLSTFNGINPNGNWTLKAADDFTSATGVLVSWEIVFTDTVVGGTYSWTSTPAGFNASIPNPSANPYQATTYNLTVSKGICTSSGQASVTTVISASQLARPYLLEGDSILCSNDPGFDMHVLDSGVYSGGYPAGTTFDFYGAGAILYQSSTSNTFFNANNSDAFFTVVTLPGNLGGCSALSDTSEIDFGNAQAPQYILSADSVNCFGESTGKAIANITFGGTPRFRWQWYNSSNVLIRDITSALLSDTLNNIPSGIYTLVLTDHQDSTSAPYCEVTDSIFVGQPAAALAITEVGANHINVTCNGGSTGAIDVTASGGTAPYLYNWSNGSSSEDITGIAAGTYTVMVTDANGCTKTLTTVITQGTALPVNITGSNSFCAGSSTTLNAGAGYASYNWSTGATLQTIPVNTAGTFTVTVTDVNGCTGLASVTTTVNPNPIPAINGATTVCFGGTTPITVSAAFNAYSWSTGATTQSIAAGGGIYTVTVTNGNDCTGSASKVITVSNAVPAQPGVITGATAVCKNSNGTYSIAPVLGATSYTWTATSGATVSTGQGSATVVINFSNTATSATLTVVANNICGSGVARTLAYTVSSTAPASPVNITGNLNALCNQASVVYSCTAVAGATSYLWTLPAGVTILTGQGTNSITVKYTGTFTTSGTLSVVAQNGCGNSTALSRTVNAKPQQPIISGQNWACKGQAGLAYSVAAVTGASAYTWTIVPGSTLVSGQGATSIIVNWGNTNGQIKCTANNGCGSSLPASLPVSFTCREAGSPEGFSELNLFPNPAFTSATLQFDGYAEGRGQLTVYDLVGQQLLNTDVKVVTGNNEYKLDLANYPKGVYTARVVYNGVTRNSKLIVQ